ncbi:MAG: glutamate--tRNA ligase [Halobacteriales archaeon]|nr:glutamate--tRNA ligase [Halobacteriales archaeon]
MDEALREEAKRAAETHALYNALAHEGEADVGALMGPLMADHPELRPHGDEVAGIAAQVVGRVNDLDADAQRERLEALAPELLAELEAPDETDDHPLPELPNVEAVDQVRMRLAPNPNGPWHIGHARMPAVIGTYKDRYDGWFVCRFDDTDPETKRPDLEAYEWILEDIDYLGFEPDEVLRASDRLDIYYDHARELIDRGGAYTCSCAAEDFSARKNAGEPCDHRDKDAATVHDEFERMVDGDYDAGEMVLRIRTDISHPNPALRDWVGFRMIDTPHPREEAADYRCWPMLDFQSGIDDQLTGVTHIIRGIDLQDSARRQGFVYDYFDWEYPEVVHWGHVQVDAYDIRLSTSRIRELLADGELDGWDDPRAPTLRSLRRRGIRGEAIVEAMVELGTSTSNVDLSMSTIYARNRNLVDDGAGRYFLVRDGVERPIVGGPDHASPPLHPDHPDRGTREIPITGAVLVEPDDLPPNGERVWLKGYGCVRHTRDAFEFTGEDIEVVRDGDVPVIHWVPVGGTVPVTLRRPTGDEAGRAEPELATVPVDTIVQFERVGFARIDARNEKTVAYFAHR